MRQHREGWAESFKPPLKKNKKAQKKEKLLMGDTIFNDFDKNEWEW
jgi:hypothetical protein